MIDQVVYVYARDEKEAKRYAAGGDDYTPWDDKEEAVRDGVKPGVRLPWEELYEVKKITSYVARKVV